MVRNKTANSLSDLSQNNHIQLVDIKAYFMNGIGELKKQIKSLKQQVNCMDKLLAENNSEILLKSQISFLQEQNYFIKTELQQKQIVIEKLLDLQKNRFQNNCFESTSKTPDNRLSNFNKMNRLNPADGSRENPQSDAKKSNHYNNPNQSSNISKKVMVIGDSIVKYLRSDEFSSYDKSISIMRQPGCSSEDMVDYEKPVARKKPDTLISHVGRNDLAKGVNIIKKVRKCVEVIWELDNTENIQIGFSSIIQRSDKDFSNEIKETNIKLMNYCLGKGFIFIDNDNINKSCLNNSELHLNKKGTQRLAKNNMLQHAT